MRAGGPRYPVDRYLVESSNKIEMVNIIGDDIWDPEPALRPEEEIVLRKLHEMLQSTADDLKLLSGELARSREPVAPARAAPAPLDEQFNEKVHIEQVVNAKFHGLKIVDNAPKLKNDTNKPQRNVINEKVLINSQPVNKKPTVTKKLTKSRTNVVQIKPAIQDVKIDKAEEVKKPIKQTVAYNEFSFQYPQPKVSNLTKGLQVQAMPCINIRSELKAQKVLHLDIVPEIENTVNKPEVNTNVAVIAMKHDVPPSIAPPIEIEQAYPQTNLVPKKQTRKVTQMLTCESSTSTNNGSSQCNLEIPTLKHISASPKNSVRLDRSKIKKNVTVKVEPAKRTHLNLDEWKKKLNSVYGQPSSSKSNNKFLSKSKSNFRRNSPKKTNITSSNVTKPQPKKLNNAQYIPYSQLTIGGVNASDIEREISHMTDKNNVPLSPILDKIINSRDNSSHNSPRKDRDRDSPKILTTSDENLLREVIDIEKTVSKTLSQNVEPKLKSDIATSDSANDDTNEVGSYADDFEDEKSDKSESPSQPHESPLDDSSSDNLIGKNQSIDQNVKDKELFTTRQKSNVPKTDVKTPNLSLKTRVDVFEYVHAIDTQDIATQSQTRNKISLKETQTSPRNESPNKPVEPIHNDLWPAMDPSKELENMFKLEKHLIKKFIIDEYGDLLQSSIDKPSTSKENQDSLNAGLNLVASQKVTQTSPKHVKSVMTSPTRTKTRTTSPFLLSVPVDHQTSPMIFVNDEKDKKAAVEQETEDLGISINLSSPRFSLRLPNTSVEVLSNLDICSGSPTKANRKNDSDRKIIGSAQTSKPVRKNESSTSVDADNSSSELSSLGEVKLKLKRRSKKSRVFLSESSSSSKLSVDFNFGSILPLRSEGEVSSAHRARSRKSSMLSSKSDGELSFGRRKI